MSRSLALALLLALIAVALGLAWSNAGRTPEAGPTPAANAPGPAPQPDATPPPGPRRAAAPTPRVTVATDPATGQLVRSDLMHAAGRRTPVTIEPVASGIRCPDGRCLPLLNGVSAAQAISRDPAHGPVPPVVAVLVDRDGWEWYEHADGSTTTCRPAVFLGPDGKPGVQIVTLHNVPQADGGPIQPVDTPQPTAPDSRSAGRRP